MPKKLSLLKVDRETYTPDQYCVYVITKPAFYHDWAWDLFDSITDTGSEIYIGMTGKKISKRWTDHTCSRKNEKKNSPARDFIVHRYGFSFNECFRVLFEGSKEECSVIEYMLRPFPNMGLNKAIGGGENLYRFHDPKLWKLIDNFRKELETWKAPF